MGLDLASEEPEASPWRVEPLASFAKGLLPGGGRPHLLALDGRSSSGKSTLAARLAARLPHVAVVHTDDIAWAHSRFGWSDLLVRLLNAGRAGGAVAFRPPAWKNHDRPGAVQVPAGLDLLIVEGVGVGRPEHRALFDAIVWVQADRDESERRGLARVGQPGDAPTTAERDAWLAEEMPFLATARPWEHADAIVCGTPTLPYDPATEVVVGTTLDYSGHAGRG